ncbi:MAG: molybdopterin molybdotransferase MoeA [Gammaproteobacteria bacterium]
MRSEARADKSSASPMKLEEARMIVESCVAPVNGYEQIILKYGPGRVLYDDIVAPFDIPRVPQSSMDGFALNSADLISDAIPRFKVVGASRAGRPFSDSVKQGDCVRIFTGADLPSGTDSVILQENVARDGDLIEVPSECAGYEYVRQPGDEIRRGQRVLEKGKRLAAADLGILASLGCNEIRVRRLPRVACFSTGDELVSLDKTLDAGKIYDSNRYLLHGMLKTLGIEAIDLGIIRDDRDALAAALQEAAAIADMIITSAGVSVGEADLVQSALTTVGEIEFWKIAMKPGKPLAFGRIGEARFFGLPGNPVSVFVTFYQIVRPALLRMMGTRPSKPRRLTARCMANIVKAPGRQEFQRARLNFDENGKAFVTPAEKQQSHNLSALAECDSFIVLPADCSGVDAGSFVEVEWIDSSFHFN